MNKLTGFLNHIERGIDPVQGLQQRLLNQQASRLAKSLTEQAAILDEWLENLYPPQSGKPRPVYYTRTRPDGSTYKSKWKTQKQQNWFFWALTTGQIDVPYRRTYSLGKVINVSVADVNKASYTLAVTAPDIPAVRYTIGGQSSYHRPPRGNWQPLADTVAASRGEIVGEMAQFFRNEVFGYISEFR